MVRLSGARVEYGVLFVLAITFASGCRKHVAAGPPAPPVVSPAAAAAPVISLRADASSIERGQATTLRWEARNATTVRIEPGIGTITLSGGRQVSPGSSVTYTATATGPGGEASDIARVTVNVPAPPAAGPAPVGKAPDLSVEDLLRANVKTIYFEYDKADIPPDQMSRLQADAAWLKEHPAIRFSIEGHCDDRGSEEYNLGLGDRRARAVKDFLVADGLPESRMNIISYGEERPVCNEASEQCYKQNRRAVFTPTE